MVYLVLSGGISGFRRWFPGFVGVFWTVFGVSGILEVFFGQFLTFSGFRGRFLDSFWCFQDFEDVFWTVLDVSRILEVFFGQFWTFPGF